MDKVSDLLECRAFIEEKISFFDYIFINKKVIYSLLAINVVSLILLLNSDFVESNIRYYLHQELTMFVLSGLFFMTSVLMGCFMLSGDFKIFSSFENYIQDVFSESELALFKKIFSNESNLNAMKYKMSPKISEIDSVLTTESCLREWHALLLNGSREHENTLDLFVQKMKEYNACKNVKNSKLTEANRELGVAGFKLFPQKEEILDLKINEH